MSCIILDIDNCISDDGWRIPRIRMNTDDLRLRFHEYHMLSAFDVPANLQNIVRDADDIIVFTARPSEYRAVTEEWLRRRAGIEPRLLIMRAPAERAPSLELKKRMLRATLRETNITVGDIVAAYDDREEIVRMYLDHGVPGRVLKCHDIPYPTQKGKAK